MLPSMMAKMPLPLNFALVDGPTSSSFAPGVVMSMLFLHVLTILTPLPLIPMLVSSLATPRL